MFLRLYQRLDDAAAGQLRLGDDFAADEIWDAGPGRRARRDARRVPRARGTRSRRSPTGWPRSEETERRGTILQELRGGHAPARSRRRRPQPHRSARRAAAAHRALDGAHRSAGRASASRRCRSTSRRCSATLLFDRLDTVVLTSATLAAGGDFAFLESRLGTRRRGFAGDGARGLSLAVRLPVAVPVRHPQRSPRAARGRARARHGGGPGRHRPGLCLRRRDVRAVHQPCVAAAGGPGAPVGARHPLADPGAGRGAARPPAPPLSRGGERHSARARTRSGKAWMCPGARSAPSCSTSYLSRCRASR